MRRKKVEQKKKITVTLKMDFDRACNLMRALETFARVGMFQFKDMFDLLKPEIDWNEADELERLLKARLDMSVNSYKGIRHTPEECQVAWDAYQWLRREISWNGVGKDWRKDKRDWTSENSMMGVCFDDPFKVSKLPGDFSTTIVEEK